jgi:hypothetical protein
LRPSKLVTRPGFDFVIGLGCEMAPTELPPELCERLGVTLGSDTPAISLLWIPPAAPDDDPAAANDAVPAAEISRVVPLTLIEPDGLFAAALVPLPATTINVATAASDTPSPHNLRQRNIATSVVFGWSSASIFVGRGGGVKLGQPKG